jgi:hypothetical protein
MRPIVQAFSIGLITGSIILGAVFLQSDGTEGELKEETITEQKAKDFLEEQGLAVVNGQRYEELVRNNQKLEAELSKLKSTNQEKQPESEPSNEDVTYTVESGMTLSEMSSDLEELNIIDDAQSFSEYMEEHEYSRAIQLGEYKLRSGLSFEEIAEILTK